MAIKIRCPQCESINTKLIDGVRERLKGYCRRYKCFDCGCKFTTVEEWCPDPKYGNVHNRHRTVKLQTKSQRQKQKEVLNEHND